MSEVPKPSRDLWSEARVSVARLERTGMSRRGLLGFGALGLSVTLVVLATLLCGLSIEGLRQGFSWVAHTNQALREISDVQLNLARTESNLRAYILTGDVTFRTDFYGARAALPRAVDRLGALVADNPEQSARVVTLRAALAPRLKRFDDGMAWGADRLQRSLSLSHDPAAMQERRRLNDTIRDTLGQLRATETQLLTDRQNDTERRSGGALFFALVSAALAVIAGAAGAVVVSQERTRHRAESLELELMHKQREIMMDQASSMLAHEINQPLTAAANYLGAAQRLAVSAGALRVAEVTQKAAAQIQRAGEIVRRLRKFIERQVPEQRSERAEVLIAEAVTLLGTLDGAITIQTSVAPGLPLVIADSVQIQQVLVNLMRNALEAMQGQERRELFLTATPGSSHDVVFALRDTGTGFSREIARKLFKPVASTKHSGMGVGLSICHTIIQAHGGRIWAEPVEEGGAVFRFTLPAERDSEIAA